MATKKTTTATKKTATTAAKKSNKTTKAAIATKKVAESKKYAAQIGMLMKQGKKDEADNAKAQVAELKAESTALQQTMNDAEQALIAHLCTIPNIPNDDVPAIAIPFGSKPPKIEPNAVHKPT